MASNSEIRIFGIRHHGPGSARALLRSLERWQPDIVLIEGPPDAQDCLRHVSDPGLRPPVALVVWNPRDLRQASFFPFAAFSPEWQAMCYAAGAGKPVQFIDLPLAFSFALRPEHSFETNTSMRFGANPDPYVDIAAMAGYSDPERWWESVFERTDTNVDPLAAFDVVQELMETLRGTKQTPESAETLLREAYMRQCMRVAKKSGAGKIAVVCGAWHAPALAQIDSVRTADDSALLKGLKKVKTTATWIPWSFDRLSFESGYRAGVVAPAWYQQLWEAYEGGATPAIVWMSQAARLLRAEGLDTSSAHVIEAVRLAESLAALRGTLLPGIEELREAAIAVPGHGMDNYLKIIDRALVVGDVMGKVPDNLQMVPLQADFEAEARGCGLAKSTQETALNLDMRKPAHQRKSRFLHRLILLEIHWGRLLPEASGKHGTFHEQWAVKWQPDFEIQVIVAGAWGNTVEAACDRKLRRDIEQQEQLPELVQLLAIGLKAELPSVIPPLLQRISAAGAVATDTLMLAGALIPLVETLRYGSARKMNLDLLEQVLEQIVPRVCLQLPAACCSLNEEYAQSVLGTLLGLNRAFGLLMRVDMEQQWQQALYRMLADQQTAPLLSGFAARLLFDKGNIDVAATETQLHFRLSGGQGPALAAGWLEGFLYGSGLLLLHHPGLWALLDAWVDQLEASGFIEILPVLRRSFSRFSGPERERMLQLARRERGAVGPHSFDKGRDLRAEAPEVAELLDFIFGGQK